MLWLSALVAVVAGLAGRVLWVPLGLVAIANVLSQVLFPFRYPGLLANDASPVALLVTRNALVAVVGLVVLAKVWRGEAAVRNPDPASAA